MSATQSEVEALSSREVMIFELSGLLLALPERVCRAAVHTALETIAAARAPVEAQVELRVGRPLAAI